MSSSQSGEGDIRRTMIEANVVDCMVALPGQLFYSTQIPACLWILAKDRSNGLVKRSRLRDRRGQILFIDARRLGALINRTRRELSAADIRRIADTYHAWRGEPDAGAYMDMPGFCRSANLGDIRAQGYVLTPGRYVGAEAVAEDEVSFGERFAMLKQVLEEQFTESRELEKEIRERLKRLGYGI